MSNRIVFRDRVPDRARLHIWISTEDEDADRKFEARVRLVDDRDQLIWDEADVTKTTGDSPLISRPLRKGRLYVAGVKVLFGDPDSEATINHALVKTDGNEYGARFPHAVPEGDGYVVGRQSIGIRMIQT